MPRTKTIFTCLAILLMIAFAQTGAASTPTLIDTSISKPQIVQQTVNWAKKHLGLTATQIEILVKQGKDLESIAETLTEPQLSDALNKLFSEQQLAGVQVINRHDPLYWLYKERFGLMASGSAPPPTQLPAWLTRRGRNWHVYLASNLNAAPIQRGDELLFPSGEPYSFSTGTEAQRSSTKIQVRTLAHGKTEQRDLPLLLKSPGQMLLEVVKTNARLIPVGSASANQKEASRSVGYLPMPTADLPALREMYLQTLAGYEKSTDTVIIDLRGPYGEGGLSGIDLFLSDKGARVHFTKKLIVLIDRYTSGGREALAAMLQRHASATLVGEQSAGLTAPVSVEDLDPGRFLLIAVHEGGKGEFGPLVPDHKVADTVAYVAGRDDVLTKALNIATTTR